MKHFSPIPCFPIIFFSRRKHGNDDKSFIILHRLAGFCLRRKSGDLICYPRGSRLSCVLIGSFFIRGKEPMTKKNTPAAPAQHPLVGRWFHTFTEEGGQRRVQYQGSILATADNGVLVQLYEWFAGFPSSQQWFAWPAVETWALYPTAKAMNEAYETTYARSRALVGPVDGPPTPDDPVN